MQDRESPGAFLLQYLFSVIFTVKSTALPGQQSYDEKELLKRLAEGDSASFTTIYKSYYASLLLYGEKIAAGNLFIAQDATAEAFIELWQKRREFENISHLMAFLRVLVHHKCVDKFRQEKKQSDMQQELLLLTDKEQEDLFLHEIFTGAGVLTRIREEVEKLPPQTREVFKLAFYEQLKNGEIALRLNIKDATVRRRKTEALHLLRNLFRGLEMDVLLFLIYAASQSSYS